MLEHNLKHLLKLLGLTFKGYEESIDELDWSYIEHKEEYQYSMVSISNYIKKSLKK